MRRRAVYAIMAVAFVAACGEAAVDSGSGEAGPADSMDFYDDAPVLFADSGADPEDGRGLDLVAPEPGAEDLFAGEEGEEEQFEEVGGLGYPCQGNHQCLSGLCVDTGADWRCTITCIEECPEDYSCLNSPAGPDRIEFHCLPDFVPY